MLTQKICKKCSAIKSLEEFPKIKTTKDGRQNSCKKCVALYKKEYRAKNKEKISKTLKDYYKNNQEVIKDRSKEAYTNNTEKIREKQKQYRDANKELIAQGKKEYYLQNKEKVQKYKTKYRLLNKEKLYVAGVQYREKNAKKVQEVKKLWHASKAGKLSAKRGQEKRLEQIRLTRDGSINKESLQDLKIRQNNLCTYCGISLLNLKGNEIHLDHIIPLSKGGKHVLENVQWTCSTCNLQKHTTLL